jgi:tRNA threonylcarbamoyladenosine modification (KEOPS) complex  Pcc1 subunit
MKARCRLEIEFPDEKSLDAAVSSVEHEGGRTERSVAKVQKAGKKLVLEIEAHDVVALRATANAFLRAFQVFEGVDDKPE